eukprot:3382054-Alexandrium_andersonii.AAC.1
MPNTHRAAMRPLAFSAGPSACAKCSCCTQSRRTHAEPDSSSSSSGSSGSSSKQQQAAVAACARAETDALHACRAQQREREITAHTRTFSTRAHLPTNTARDIG